MAQAHIMVVEDEVVVGLDIQRCLESFGYEVSGPITSGEEAVRRADTKKPDLVLMDIMLQGKLDGVAAAQQIHSSHGIPVVFLTAHAEEPTLARAKVTEPYGYILKPFKKIELRTVIELALYRNEIEGRRPQANSEVRTVESSAASLADLLAQSEKRALSVADRENIVTFLQEVEPFSNLKPHLLNSMSEVCLLQHFKSGEFLLLEGDEASTPFLVISGRVVLIKGSASGKDLIVELVPPRDPFGLLAAFEKGNAPFSAKAQIDSVILWVPRKIVAHILDYDPEIGRRLIDKVLERLRKSHDLSRALAHDRVEIRVASVLLAMLSADVHGQNKNGNNLEVRLSRQELAEMTGTTPETASRVANALEREGLLDLSNMGRVRVLDRESLSEMIEL